MRVWPSHKGHFYRSKLNSLICRQKCPQLRSNRPTSRGQVFISLCPVGVDQRDVWKEPLALVVGLARPLPIKSLVGLEAIRPTLQSFWETATERLGNGHWRDQALRPDVSCTEPILAVWPLRLAGGASMMQDPHLIPYSDGTAIVIMDITVLKCRGGWTQSSQSLGGPALTEAACVRSIAAAHVAWQEWAYLLVFVGKKHLGLNVVRLKWILKAGV